MGRARALTVSDDVASDSQILSAETLLSGVKRPRARVDYSPETGQANISELRDALLEAHSQRACVQRAAGNLKHRLDIAKTDSRRLEQIKLGKHPLGATIILCFMYQVRTHI